MIYNCLRKHIMVLLLHLLNKRKTSNSNLLVFQVHSHTHPHTPSMFLLKSGLSFATGMAGSCAGQQIALDSKIAVSPFLLHMCQSPGESSLLLPLREKGSGVRKQFLLHSVTAGCSQQCRCYFQCFFFYCREAANLALWGSLPCSASQV